MPIAEKIYSERPEEPTSGSELAAAFGDFFVALAADPRENPDGLWRSIDSSTRGIGRSLGPFAKGAYSSAAEYKTYFTTCYGAREDGQAEVNVELYRRTHVANILAAPIKAYAFSGLVQVHSGKILEAAKAFCVDEEWIIDQIKAGSKKLRGELPKRALSQPEYLDRTKAIKSMARAAIVPIKPPSKAWLHIARGLGFAA